MNEQELRSLVREAVARHLGAGPPAAPRPEHVGRGFSRAADEGADVIPLQVYSSHTLYTGLVNIGDACVIEPAVKCDHCGYCKSHGY